MSKVDADPGGGVGPLALLAGATSTGPGASYELQSPVRFFGLQVVAGSTSAVVLLQGSIASSSDAPLTTLLTWSSDVSGSILSVESTAPISRVAASLEGGASSGGLRAWFSASP